MPDYVIPLASVVIGLVSGWVGAYLGLKVGVAKLEWNADDMRKKVDNLTKRSEAYNEDLLIHDLELEDVMRKLELPRKRRQNWRFD